MSEQIPLFHEDVNDALRSCIRALGGFKKVAHALRPDKAIDVAARWLQDCLNPSEREKLDLDQVLWILCEARKIGCHAAMNYIARHSGYGDPQPIEPEDERALLQREFITAMRSFHALANRMERAGLELPPLKSVA